MPQLSPLNWIFLFLLFWLMVFLALALIWWQKKLSYKFSKKSKFIENKWNW